MASVRRIFLQLFRGKRGCGQQIHVSKLLYYFAILQSIATVAYVLVSLRDVKRVGHFTAFKGRRLSQIDFTVEIKTSKVIATVDERFLSVCLGWRNRDRSWKFNSTTERRFIALTKALSPAYVRFGGIPGNVVYFQSPDEETRSPYGKKTVRISGEDLDRINQIAENAGWQVLFTLSELRRLENGEWDSRNPFRIVKYIADKGYKFGWELGNESNHMKEYNVEIVPEQLAEDFGKLRQYLTNFPAIEHFVVGPDVTQPRGNSMEYLQRFLEKGHSSVNAVTWHHYYVRSQDCSLPQFYVPQVLDTLNRDIEDVNVVVSKTAPGLPKWLGETSSASGGGAVGISDRFVAGFMWLDKLGLAAQHGYKVVIRQAMFSGMYSLIGENLDPNPDYWLSLLHKMLFGTKVLEVKRGCQDSEMVRVYAHCTNTKHGYYKQGAVSLMAMNLHPNKDVQLHMVKTLQGHEVDEYLLTPDGNVTSRRMKLNGKLLKLDADSSFPIFEPHRVQPGERLILPPLTYAFYVVAEAQAPACLGSQSN